MFSLETSTRSGLEVVVLMSVGMVVGEESLVLQPGRSTNILVEWSISDWTLETREFKRVMPPCETARVNAS